MEAIRKELENQQYWEATYNKMILKQGFSKEDKDKIWQLKEIYKYDIIDKLMSGEYEWSIPRRVEIAKHESKKKRVVYIYNIEDRYVLGVLYRAVSAFYRDDISKSCFSYKTGENTGHAIQYIKDNRGEELKFGVKVDIHAYFNSVSREKVVEMINELFNGGLKKTIENLMLSDKVMWNGEEIKEWKALIPGCAFGSFFANWCLKPCDEYFDNQNKVYARYSDDIIVLDKSKEDLQKDLDIIIGFLEQYGLTMNPEKYTWFEPGDDIEYLGLKLRGDGKIDISDHAKQKIKKQIHRWCRKGRVNIEKEHESFELVARRIIRQLNNKNLFCAINNDTTFGWAMYSFPRITTTESLKEIDLYTKDTLRAMKTGKHNKANYKAMTEEEFHKLGWISLVQMYNLYKQDYDYFMEVIELNR
jgi:hypothetical protein